MTRVYRGVSGQDLRVNCDCKKSSRKKVKRRQLGRGANLNVFFLLDEVTRVNRGVSGQDLRVIARKYCKYDHVL